MEENEYVLKLEDENGNEIEGSIIGGFKHNDREIIVIEVLNNKQKEFIIMEMKENSISPIESEDEYTLLCDIFENQIWAKRGEVRNVN